MKFKYTPEGDKRSEKWGYEVEAKKMLKFINKDSVIFDIGANIFDHTIYFAKNFSDAKVHAFEPIKEYYEMGLKNLEEFKVKNVWGHNLAVGNVSHKEIIMNVSNEGSSILFSENGVTEKVKTITIDDFVKENNIMPTVLKIDVEGYAYPVLEGAKHTLDIGKDITIFLEPHPVFLDVKELMKKITFLYDLGYMIIKSIYNREFVLRKATNGMSIKKIEYIMRNKRVEILRMKLDKETKSSEVQKLKSEYKNIKTSTINPFYKLWPSILHRFFTNKKAK